MINPKYEKRIQILREDLDRGKSLYIVKHKRGYFYSPKANDVPEIHRTHTTFEQAEHSALYLLSNYEKYFMA